MTGCFPGHNETAPLFAATVEHSTGERVVRLSGELDLAAKDELERALAAACSEPGVRVSVDASFLSFIDAACLGVLAGCDDGLRADGREGLLIYGASDRVERVLSITQLTGLLADHPNEKRRPAEGGRDDLSSAFESASRQATLTVRDLFVSYFALGGTAELARLEAHLKGERWALDAHQHDVAVHALNEYLLDLGFDELVVPYVAAATPSERSITA